MNVDQIKKLMMDDGVGLKEESAINHGTSLKFENGSIVNVYDTGNFSVQGKDQERVKALLDGKTNSSSLIASNKKVFVVYGHDLALRGQLEAMLRRWNLEPLILDQMPSEGQTIIEKLENYTNEVNFAVVLATPDDEGYKAGHTDEKAFRARQNVVLELGMLLSKLGRKKVAIILKQQENMERPSDIQGLIYIPFKDNLEKDAGLLLAKEMHAQGYQIDVGKI
jgi:predicted nucleotide-binding protein